MRLCDGWEYTPTASWCDCDGFISSVVGTQKSVGSSRKLLAMRCMLCDMCVYESFSDAVGDICHFMAKRGSGMQYVRPLTAVMVRLVPKSADSRGPNRISSSM